jgi:mannose-6-phosphate isomerase-like protein (cupin superfamily)
MKPVADADRIVANVNTAEFTSFFVDGEPLPKQSVLQLNTSKIPGVGFHIYRLEPGGATQNHEHTCDEEFYVIEGELIDHDGTVYRAGDLVLLRKGTQHNSHSKTGCLLAVYVHTPETNL